MAQILSDVEAFLKATGMAATRFGDKAMGDRHLVRQLRGGRRLWPETEKKVRDFMADHSASANEQAAA
ncbi:hypothetical protein KZ810_13155 [Sphingomonas sp. RHCKR47]|uniref:hypothetical protein n=1 Tax=Sphingomonas citricola TaxID=2862498 RepID=UPI001CA58CBF|nr:hypothetical protein [Sphingomonas citricola]MBW6524450.1 hypothetical protein [Sphingomonas citricola]